MERGNNVNMIVKLQEAIDMIPDYRRGECSQRRSQRSGPQIHAQSA